MWQAIRRELAGALRSVRYDLYQHSVDQDSPHRLRKLGLVLGGTAALSAAGALAVVQFVDWSVPRPPAAAFPAPPPEAGAPDAAVGAPGDRGPTAGTSAAPRSASAATPSPPGRRGAAARPASVWAARELPDADIVPADPRTPPPRPTATAGPAPTPTPLPSPTAVPAGATGGPG